MTELTCPRCSRKYKVGNLLVINCVCGARVFNKDRTVKKSVIPPESIPPKPIEEEPKEEKAPEPPKEEKSLFQKLIDIPGIAEKTAKEICEEYKNIEEIKIAIRNKSFSVGGVGFLKKGLILRLLN